MNPEHAQPQPTAATREVIAQRMATGDQAAPVLEEQVQVAVEAAITLDVERVDSYTLLCTPQDLTALALGFLCSEGLIDRADEVTRLERCAEDPSIMRVRLRNPVPRIGDEGRNLLIVSSCGLCGAESLGRKLASLPRVADTLRIDCRLLRLAMQRLRGEQPLFEACGGTHAAGIFDRSGRLLTMAEDTGRHNALDKAIGKALLGNLDLVSCGVVLSGRVSLEMIAKCARAGIELVSAVSAPTSLAIEVAEQCQITLCAFVRETRATAFSHPHRLTTPML